MRGHSLLVRVLLTNGANRVCVALGKYGATKGGRRGQRQRKEKF